jgi:hypothetical protein
MYSCSQLSLAHLDACVSNASFWLRDDRWSGSSEQPSVTVQAATFEQAKCDMELALAQHLELLLSGEKQAKGRAA